VGVVAGFVEVFLAKEGHNGLVGMNLLTKIQHSHLAILYGAMLAGVDYILMGAGIPKEIPALLDQLALNQTVRVKLDVEESKSSHGEEVFITFAPDLIFPDNAPPIQRPYFFPIVSSHSLAMMLSRKSSGKVDGFIVEGHQAGGHNAPPRGGIVLENGEVQYGARDKVDLEVMQSLGLPFWLAGGMASPSLLKLALKVGASGIQVGTLFALSEESGFMPQIKESLMKSILQDTWTVITDPYASPTGFPFKIVSVPGSLSESKIYETRSRRCGLGYLRAAYRQEDGTIGFRCPGESITGFIQKGGSKEKAINCKCLCNSLLAAVGLPQQRDGGSLEPPIITGGGEARQLKQFLATLPSLHFQTVKAINYLLQDITWCFTI
jgi:NAD(P)H-dependent flavin oxidoreductase YrpB (nitropropane dioxygenase family)